MTYKILITDHLSPQGLAHLEAADDVVYDVVAGLTPDEFVTQIADYDGLIIRSSVKVTKEVLANADHLKVIGRAGVGLDNVDIDEASLRGIVVLNTPGANTIATTEHALAMLLAVCRHIPRADASVRAKEWTRKKFLGVQLYRKILGIIGLGRIGTQVAKRARSFGMKVVAYDPYINAEVTRQLKVELVELDELLAQSDFVSLHGALTPETRHLINAQAIAKMKKGARLVNCARGQLIDETALADALQSGHVAGAALDVFSSEPLPADSPLRHAPNLILTPHVAASTIEAQRDVSTQVVDRVLSALKGQDFRNVVNMPVANPNIFKEIRPYLLLAEKLGALQIQMAHGPITRVEIEVQGDEVSRHVKPLVVALLKGMLDTITDIPVNYISAPHLALQRGIIVTETRGLPKPNYANLISCRAVWSGGDHFIAGSLLGKESPRMVQIDEFQLDARLDGIILVMESLDVPGVVGQVATLLGRHQINIAEWRMGRTEPEHQPLNLSFINLDSPASPEILEQLMQLDKVLSVREVTL